jgi:hypothetical protein
MERRSWAPVQPNSESSQSLTKVEQTYREVWSTEGQRIRRYGDRLMADEVAEEGRHAYR